jgi:tetratricopeptide (TPR) repeat protein
MLAGAALTFLVSSCGPSGGAGKSGATEPKEIIFQRGHQFYLSGHPAEAEGELKRAAAMDSTYADPLVDLAQMSYEAAMREEGEKNPQRLSDLRSAREFYERAERLGYHDALAYDRLCEISLALEEERAFLVYAKKNAERYPFDRQYYNLGVAYFALEDWNNVVKSQREAAERFKQSPYVGAYYRQTGRAYMKLNRDQSAERTFSSGVQAVDARLAVLRRNGTPASADEYRRLQDDKIGMLLLLKRLHTTYKDAEKLEQVERQLKEAGYPK